MVLFASLDFAELVGAFLRVVARLRAGVVVFFLVAVRFFALRVAAGLCGVVVCGAASASELNVNAATNATSNTVIDLRIMHILPRKVR